jgi:sulfur dioxygenase
MFRTNLFLRLKLFELVAPTTKLKHFVRTFAIKMPHEAGGMTEIFFRQLFDHDSSTYTYLLGDPQTNKAILIDPVLEQVERDANYIKELGLDLKFVINTHIHADHITGSGLLKRKYFPQACTVLGLKGNEMANADLKLNESEVLRMGPIELEFRSTPGHTHGCHTLVFEKQKMVFTGDTVLIRGCGRTDFQQGDAASLYSNVWEKIFILPDDVNIYPAHDYKGRTMTTVGEEKRLNPRLSKSKNEFIEIMKNLKLDYPKKINEAVPMNMVCGLYDLLSKEDMEKLKSHEVQGSGSSVKQDGGSNANKQSAKDGSGRDNKDNVQMTVDNNVATTERRKSLETDAVVAAVRSLCS